MLVTVLFFFFHQSMIVGGSITKAKGRYLDKCLNVRHFLMLIVCNLCVCVFQYDRFRQDWVSV